MNNTVLTDEQIRNLGEEWGCYFQQVGSEDECIRAIEQAVLQSPEVQELYDLLKESRQQLPLAALFWNEDDEPDRGRRNARHVIELIARVDAAMEKKP